MFFREGRHILAAAAVLATGSGGSFAIEHTLVMLPLVQQRLARRTVLGVLSGEEGEYKARYNDEIST